MDRYKRAEISVMILLPAVVVSLVISFVLYKWPLWWKWVNLESSPMTTVEFSILLLTAFTITGCLLLSFLSGGKKKDIILWAVLAAAFYYLAADEAFAIHEAIRNKILAPHNIKFPLFFWTSPGDFVLLLFFLAGLALAPMVIKLLSARKSSVIMFICAAAVTAAALFLDSMNFHKMKQDALIIEQFIEELLETTGMILFFNSFFLIFMKKLKDLSGVK